MIVLSKGDSGEAEMELLGHYRDRQSGVGRRIEDFQRIFELQMYTSIAGIAFSLLWYLLATTIKPEIEAKFGFYFYATALTFCITTGIAVWCRALTKDAVSDQNGNHTKDAVVRKQTLMLSASNTLVFGFLIFLTGGALSALIPLYAMTFTLTISEARVQRLITLAFFFFASVLILASSYWWFDLISKEILFELTTTPKFYVVISVLSFMSILVPYLALFFTQPSLPVQLGSAVQPDNRPNPPSTGSDENE